MKINGGFVIEPRLIRDAAILDCKGKLLLTEDALMLHSSVLEALKNGSKKVVINLENVSDIDSAGLGGLLSIIKAVSKSEGQLRLLKVPKKVMELLVIAKVLDYFKIYGEEEAVLASF